MTQRKSLDEIFGASTSPSTASPTGKKSLDEIFGSAPAPKPQPGFLQSMAQGIAAPFLKTGLGIARAAEGVKSLFGTPEEQSQTLENMGKPKDFGYLGEVAPIGSDQQGNPLSFGQSTKQGIGLGLELGSYAVGGEGVGSVVGKVAKGALGRAAATGAIEGAIGGALGQGGAELGKPDSTLGQVGLQTGIGALGGGFFGGALASIPGVVKGTSEALNPNKIMQRVARLSKSKQAKFEETAGESVGNYLVKRGIYGDVEDLTTQLYSRFKSSKDVADKALATLPGEYKSAPIKTALTELIQREKRVSSPGALSKDMPRVRALVKQYNERGLNMSEVNEVKRLYERNVKLDYLKSNLVENVARANNIDSALRSWQFEQADKLGFKNLQEVNKETRLAKQLLDDLGAEHAGSAGNNAISLTDWIVLSGGEPSSIAAFLTKKALSSKKLQSGVAKTLAPKPTVGLPKAVFGKARDDFSSFTQRTTQQFRQPR